MAARKYTRKTKVYSSRSKTPVKNNWKFRANESGSTSSGTWWLEFYNTNPDAKYAYKKVNIPRTGSIKIEYSNGITTKVYTVKRTARFLDSHRKYKNKI